jgi:hypothetical protein
VRQERKVAKALWAAGAVMTAMLAWTLYSYFSDSAEADSVPVYESPVAETIMHPEDMVGKFGRYQRLRGNFPQDVIKQAAVVREPGLDTYIEIAKVFVDNTRFRMCKINRLRAFPANRQLDTDFLREGDILPDETTKVKEIREDGVLFAREGKEDIFLPVKHP